MLLLYKQVALHSFMGAGRRHKSSGSEMKDNLLLSVARVSHFVLVL